MALIRPAVINPRPGIIAPVLGGFAGTLLLTSGMFLAPRVGLPFLDVPHLIGGIVTTNLTAAFWLGFWAHFLAGSLAFPVLFGLFWPLAPGRGSGIVGELTKGLIWGTTLWLLSGLLMPVAGWLNRLPADVVARPGLFAITLGFKAALALLAGHVAYGLAVGSVAHLVADVFPLETLGWPGYRNAELPPAGALYPDPTLPEHPFIGER